MTLYRQSKQDLADEFLDIFPAQVTAGLLGTSAGVNGDYIYSWIEQEIKTDTTGLVIYTPVAGGRSGTVTSGSQFFNPATELNNQNVTSSLPLYCWMRLKGLIDSQTIYEFDAGQASTSTTTVPVINYPGPPTSGTFSLVFNTVTSLLWVYNPVTMKYYQINTSKPTSPGGNATLYDWDDVHRTVPISSTGLAIYTTNVIANALTKAGDTLKLQAAGTFDEPANTFIQFYLNLNRAGPTNVQLWTSQSFAPSGPAPWWIRGSIMLTGGGTTNATAIARMDATIDTTSISEQLTLPTNLDWTVPQSLILSADTDSGSIISGRMWFVELWLAPTSHP